MKPVNPEPVQTEQGLSVLTKTHEEVFIIYLGDREEDRVINRLVFGKWRQLVDFCLQQQVYIGETWEDVARHDCSHNEVHVHFFSRESKKSTSRRRVADLSDINVGYEEATGRLYDDWMENRRRYFHGRRKT